MGQELRILLLEDRKEDSKLIHRELRNGGLSCNLLVVETEDAFVKGIKDFNPDSILADYKLPAFDGMSALAIARENCPDIPFIFVSATIGEDLAIETLKQGATDYVLKNRLSRLVPVVTRALKEDEVRALQRQAEQALRASEQHYRFLFDNMLNGYAHCKMIFEQSQPKDFIYLSVNNAFEALTGLRNVVGKKVSDVIPDIQESNPELFEIYGRVALTGNPEQFETYIQPLEMWFSISVYSPQKEHFVAVFDVITERKKTEKEIRRLNRLYDVLSQVNQAIVRTQSRDELFSEICRLVVERGNIDLSWIGLLDPSTSRINPAAHFGSHHEILSQSDFYVDDRPEGQGNPGKAIRKGQASFCNRCGGDVCLYPSATAPIRFGFQSCGSFPLRFQGRVCGVLNVCVFEGDFFGEREIELLEEVALAISFALDKIVADTQRKRFSEQLQQQSTFLQTLIEAMPCLVFYKDNQLQYLGCNNAFEQFLGAKKDQIIGKSAYDIWPHDLADALCRGDQELLAGNSEVRHLEGTFLGADGTRKDFLSRKATFADQDGNVGGIIGAMVDITERRATEMALLESEELYRITFELAAVGIAHLTPDGRWLRVNHRLCEITGYSREELLRKQFQELTHPDDLDSDLALMGQVLASEIETYTKEKRYIKRDGSVIWISLTVALKREDDGRPNFFISVYKDITARKNAEEALRASEQRFRSLFEGHRATMLLFDPDSGAILDVNEAAVEFYGFSKTELCAMNIAQINQLPEEELATVRQSILERKTNSFVFPHRLRSGEIRTVQVYSSPIDIRGRTALFSIVHDITERKQAEEALRKSEEKYRELVENANSIILRWDIAGNVTFFNEFAQSFFGYSEEEILGKNLVGTIVPEFESATGRNLQLMVEDITANPDTYINNENENMRSNGERVWIAWTNKPVFDQNGRVREILGIGNDISERKRADKLIRLRLRLLEFAATHSLEELLRKTLDEVGALTNSPIGFYHFVENDEKTLSLQAWSTQTTKEFCKAGGKGLHYSIDQAGVWVDCAHERRPVIHNDYSALSHRKGMPAGHAPVIRELVLPILRSDRVVAILGIGNKPTDYTDKDVEVVSYLADIAWEITTHKRAEQELAQEAIRRRILFEQSRDGIVVLDQNGKVYEANQRFAEMLGYSAEEISQLHVWDWDVNRTQEDLLERIRLADVEGSVFETRHRRKDGTIYDVEISKNGVELNGEKLVFCAHRDISYRKAAEQTLRDSEERLTLALAASQMGVWEWDLTANTIFWSPECYNIFGVNSFGGKLESFTELVHPEDLDRVWLRIKQALEERTVYKDEFRITQPGGDVRWVSCLGQANYDADGKPLRLIGNIKDISERKQAETERAQIEAQLRQAQKMEALGTLAGGIAHDFNNILGIIMGFTELAKLDSGEESPVRENFDEVLKAANRAKELVKQILAFSRKTEQQKIPMQLGLIVKEALLILRPSLPSTIEIKMEVHSKAPVLADPTQIHQVLMNLCTNAAHAMQDQGGVLQVSLTNVMLEGESIPSHAGLKPGPYLELTVNDTGCGIDPALIDSIFDPFFTTKGPGEGTGLGLSVVHGIVESLEGKIDVKSEPGKGTRFTLLIPALKSEYAQKKVEAQTLLPHGQERVLVVDDEPQLAEVLQRMLKGLGYDVVTCASGTEALEVLCHQPIEKRFDLVITDMTMPHFTGADLAGELRGFQPVIPVILMTGFSKNMDAEKVKSLGIQGFLMKPVALDQLAKTVREVLDLRVEWAGEADLQAI
ncbi:MAG: PAS domain S-box protein [Syntrophobacteraceae bacterium]